MRYHSLEAVMLALMASLMVIAPSEAIRGSHHHMVAPHRSLQEGLAEGRTAAPKEPKEAPAEKEDKEAPAAKKDKDTTKKSNKKDKKACKKADKKDKKKRRGLQDETAEQEVFEGDVTDLDYCLQGELSAVQCANLDAIPSDGKIVSMLKLELVHPNEKEPDTITEEAEGILDNGDTELRFVGCKAMDAPPPPPKKGDSKKTSVSENNGARRRRLARFKHGRKLQADNEVEFKSEEEDIDVVGVDFKNLKIVKNGCQTDAPEGSVCDVIESNVDIFYQSGAGQDPSDEDKEDMHNLLVETIMKQAKAGAFGSLGSIQDAEVSGGSGGRGGLFGSSGSDGGGTSILPIVLGVVAALVAVGCLYWFCCTGSDEKDHGEIPVAKPHEDTSDEEHSSDEEETRAVPMAEVLSVEDPAVAKKDAKSQK